MCTKQTKIINGKYKFLFIANASIPGHYDFHFTVASFCKRYFTYLSTIEFNDPAVVKS